MKSNLDWILKLPNNNRSGICSRGLTKDNKLSLKTQTKLPLNNSLVI